VLVPSPRDNVPVVTKDDVAIIRAARLDAAVARDEVMEEPAAGAPAADEQANDLPVTVPIERVCEALADAASTQGLPIGFFARLIWQESRFDQWARSHAGAMGVAQFMPLTAVAYGLQDPFDPLQSVKASARFLRELRDQFGNLGLAAAAYNAGGGRIRKWLNGQSSLPEETRNYVEIITGHPPKRWTVQKPLRISFALPGRAPCDGVEGLSRSADTRAHEVRLTELAADLIEEAEEARRRAKIAAAKAARNKRLAAAKAKGRKVATAKVAAKPGVKVRVAAQRGGAGS
jgi:Transglycosylase SLT domain